VERSLGVTEARKELARIIDDVKYKGDNYVIVKHGQPAAVVVPVDLYRRWKEEREELFALIREMQTPNLEADPNQVMQEVLHAQQSIRRPAAE